MPVVTAEQLKAIKRKAKVLSRTLDDKSYMQCLDLVCQEDMGLRHFHEAQKLATKSGLGQTLVGPQAHTSQTPTPWTMYLQACQESYFEI